MKLHQALRTETNSTIYKRWLKKLASCPFCPWHRKENATRSYYEKNWKSHRKTQWRFL